MSGSISPGGLTWIEKCEISLDQDIGWLNINIFDYAEPWTENLEEMLLICSFLQYTMALVLPVAVAPGTWL